MTKATLIIINSIWVTLSILIAVLGYQLVSSEPHNSHLEGEGEEADDVFSNARAAGMLALLVGCAGILPGLMGCLGAWREKTCLINTYAIFLAIIALCELGVGITAVVYRQGLGPVIEGTMQQQMNNYGVDGFDGERAAKFWDSTQRRFSCCGVRGYTDWAAKLTLLLPESCCKDLFQGTCDRNILLPINVNTGGCLQAVSATATIILLSVGVVCIVSGALKMIGSICGCVLTGEILRERAREEERVGMVKLEEEHDQEEGKA